MAARGRLARTCRTLLLAVSMIAISAATAAAQEANELETLNTQILADPQNAELNMRYARAAEAQGKPRLALAAYERILINNPDYQEARAGYERVRRVIEPGYTVTRLDAGVRWDSNALNLSDDTFVLSSDELEATTYYAKLMVADERVIGDRRWRSILALDLEETPDIDVLDYGFVGLQTGPIFYAGPHVAVLPSIGAGAAWLGGDLYYTEANVGVTLEGRMDGASYWARLRGGYREYDPDTNAFFDTVTENGPYAELRGGYTRPNVLSERGTLLVAPFVRWSDVDGGVFSFSLFDDLYPGRYTEYGAEVTYAYQVSDRFTASVGALVRERDFGDSSREDTYLSPQASLAVSRPFGCGCDLELQYRYRDNDTNDFLADYQAEQVSLSLRTRF